MKPLTILSVASSFVPIGRDSTGGSEQIAYRLDQALTRAGHRSIMVACEGSEISGTLIPIVPITQERSNITSAMWSKHRECILECLERWPVDLVHIHSIDFEHLLPPDDVKTLITLHMPKFWYSDTALMKRPNVWMHGVSVWQHNSFSEELGFLDPIHNGVPIELLRMKQTRRSFALNLGRICPEKGVHNALEACRQADHSLIVAGDVFPFKSYVRYMKEQVTPLLDLRRRYIGPVGFDRKRRYLSAAKCVLIPVEEAETSCLVAMESIACGTPVIAFPKGAIAETVSHGETGLLVRDVYEMSEALAEVDRIDRSALYRFADTNFSEEVMISKYLDRYARISEGVEDRWPTIASN